MKLLEKKISIDNAIEIYDIIDFALKRSHNTQIFVNEKILNHLESPYASKIWNIFTANFVINQYYNEETLEPRWMHYQADKGDKNKTVFRSIWLPLVKGYGQLSYYKSVKSNIEYRNTSSGLTQILVIDIKK